MLTSLDSSFGVEVNGDIAVLWKRREKRDVEIKVDINQSPRELGVVAVQRCGRDGGAEDSSDINGTRTVLQQLEQSAAAAAAVRSFKGTQETGGVSS